MLGFELAPKEDPLTDRDCGQERFELGLAGCTHRPDIAGRHSIRMPYRGLASKHRNIAEVSSPLERTPARYEYLPAPDRPVRAVARPVVCDADNRTLQSVFGHRAHDVRVVVLYDHSEHRCCRVVVSEVSRHVVGVHVMSDDLRLRLEQANKGLD